jgi:allantoate deiminase
MTQSPAPIPQPDMALAARLFDILAEKTKDTAGFTRASYGDGEQFAYELMAKTAREAGLLVDSDVAGNLYLTLKGRDPAKGTFLIGSHVDTVPQGGNFDGAAGVIAGVAILTAWKRAGFVPSGDVAVIVIRAEESTWFPYSYIGSKAALGLLPPAALDIPRADTGRTLAQHMAELGFNPNTVAKGETRWTPENLRGYVELHIEQGPVLEAENQPIGVVTAISGATRFNIALEGEAGHAGTVPMGLRRDALAGAAECIAAIERLCAAGEGAAGTVGQIAAEPGAANVIPGRARFSVDLRAPGDELREETVARVLAAVEAIAARRGLIARIVRTHENATAPCAPWLRAQLGEAVAAEGYPIRELPSGAGHDGMAMIDIADIAMLFVRCRRGVSHHPGEHVSDEDVAVSAQVLSRFIRSFRRVPGDRRTD